MMNKKVLLQDLSDRMAQRRSVSKKDADLFVRSVFEIIGEYLQTDKIVKIKGLGTFKLVMVESRASVDVNTGERIVIKGYTKVSFTPDAVLRDEINKPFAQFETVILNEGTDVSDMERVEETAKTQELPVSDNITEEDNELPVAEPAGLDGSPSIEGDEVAASPVGETNDMEVVMVETAAIDDDVAEVGTEANEQISEKESEDFQGECEAHGDSAREVGQDVVSPVSAPVEDAVQTVMHQVGSQQVEFQKVEHQTVENQHIVQVASEQSQCRCSWSVWNWLILVVLVLFLMCGSYYAGHKHMLCGDVCAPSATLEKPAMKKKSASARKPKTEVVQKNGMKQDIQKTDTLQKTVSVQPEVVEKSTYPQVENGEYDIVGTKEVHRLAAGETLRGLALKYYGSKDYVKYIIAYNEIKNPDLVPVNMELKMPDLKLKRR